MSEEENGYNSSGSSSDRPWIDQFEELCSSGDLSLDELQRMTKGITLDNLHNSSFLHRVCMNRNVTLEIVPFRIPPILMPCPPWHVTFLTCTFPPLHLNNKGLF